MAIDESSLREYRRALEAIGAYLARFGVRDWPERLRAWVSELDAAVEARQGDRIVAHVARSQRATGGMGSLGDIFISPEAGDQISGDEHAIRQANDQLNVLVNELYRQTLTLLNRDLRQAPGR